ncbi:MAG: hypothetical protein AAF391_11415 [Bacteroidota bacterium]
MNQFFAVLPLIIFLSACTERFEIIDPAKFNRKLESRTDIETAEQLIEVYYNYSPNEGIPDIEIVSKTSDSGWVEVTLIHDRQPDDAQRAIKIVMTATLVGERWFVQQIKMNRKCYKGRGHTNWGTEWCS